MRKLQKSAIQPTSDLGPRSIYAGRLGEFSDFAFDRQGDQAIVLHRGHWSDFFRRRIGPAYDGRVILEIGCADADYLGRIAQKYPQAGFIGLDWKFKAIYDGARRVGELGLNNVALLRGRAQDLLKFFADKEVDEIWIFHPEPCEREVELPNRLICPAFIADAQRVLRDESSILALKTDHADYFQWARACLEATGKLTLSSENFWQDAAALAHTAGRYFAGEATAFESRFIRKRRAIYYLELAGVAGPILPQRVVDQDH